MYGFIFRILNDASQTYRGARLNPLNPYRIKQPKIGYYAHLLPYLIKPFLGCFMRGFEAKALAQTANI